MRAPEFWNRTDRAAQLIGTALTPLGWLYGASIACKRSHAHPYRAKAQVICIGNLTAGGVGKTPVALAVAQYVYGHGRRPVFLSRGYGGRARGPLLVDPVRMDAAEVGDEPLLLARHHPVIVARDRRAGARLAEQLGFDMIVMDDGHQNFALAKDLSLVVIDGDVGFGNGRLIPAGPLREPLARGLRRADAAIVVGGTIPELGAFPGPVLRARVVAVGDGWSGRRVVAFAGIGRPEKFFASLRACGAELAACYGFADHHPYTAHEIKSLRGAARLHDAVLITTEKDYVRLMPKQREGIATLAIEMRFAEPQQLESLLNGPGTPA